MSACVPRLTNTLIRESGEEGQTAEWKGDKAALFRPEEEEERGAATDMEIVEERGKEFWEQSKAGKGEEKMRDEGEWEGKRGGGPSFLISTQQMCMWFKCELGSLFRSRLCECVCALSRTEWSAGE